MHDLSSDDLSYVCFDLPTIHYGSTVKPRLTASLFWPPSKTAIHFFVKKPSLIQSHVNTANIFLPIGDRINGVPL